MINGIHEVMLEFAFCKSYTFISLHLLFVKNSDDYVGGRNKNESKFKNFRNYFSLKVFIFADRCQ